ncbi:glycosyltransferase family 2 protein [Ammonifex thiophilus]|uniref:Glycosyltransferase n=1 Tax=Ammonifex thiophilus TaxID=444093 RepID=A0A3D8P4U8_9THEO|nr:glycosyltransferase family 2 protein [Ammonifex thiophilus]RDV82505.1 glycosyltransferase [Ammonifex thiophilus]
MAKILFILQLALAAYGLYHILLSFFSLHRRVEDYSATPPRHSFAVVIAAHNEEKVIGELIKSVFRSEYPRELYEVFVVADNCTDRTAEIARSLGATVIERYNPHERGKGYALEYGFQRIFALPRKFDAFIILDADNLVSPHFLQVMNHRLARGEKIIQGYLDTKNPDDTWISRSIYVGYLISNRFCQLARHNLGLSCALGGTGMCIAAEVLKRFGWGMTTLTEDLEFQTKALLCGLRVTWAHEAAVYDEKPLTLKQSWRQRQRWMQGHCQVAGRYFFRLMWEGIRTRDFKKIDGALYLLRPYFTMMVGLAALLSIFELDWSRIDLWWFVKGFSGQYLYMALALLLERAPLRAYLWLLYYPVFALTWIPITYAGFIYRHRRAWCHTQHVRNISWEQLKTWHRYRMQRKWHGAENPE